LIVESFAMSNKFTRRRFLTAVSAGVAWIALTSGRISELGSYLRFGDSVLPDEVRELAILWTARRLGAAYEWVKHVPPARQAGIPEAVIEALRREQQPDDLTTAQEAALSVVECVLERRSIPQDTQDALAEQVGLKGVIELVVLCGFYQMISAVVFAFDVPLPEGARDPFSPGAG
jgi:4-carboxymuconolactone decarboxylase